VNLQPTWEKKVHDKNVILENIILKKKISAALMAGNKSLELLTWVQTYKVGKWLLPSTRASFSSNNTSVPISFMSKLLDSLCYRPVFVNG
jgi:hypothetical protein